MHFALKRVFSMEMPAYLSSTASRNARDLRAWAAVDSPWSLK
jgi:hypothetical protein